MIDSVVSSLSREQKHALGICARAEAAKRCAARGDILGWGFYAMPSKFFLPFCRELHQYFVDIRNEEMTSTEAPRGHSKTTVRATFIPIFQALEEPKKYDFYLNVQKTAPKAIAVNTSIKAELEENPVLRYLYGNQVGARTWTERVFVMTNGTVFMAAGAGQSIRGMQYRNRRPTYIIVDDLYDEDEIDNAEAVERKNSWFWGSLYPARAKGRGSGFHVQGTAISKNDVLAQMAQQPGVTYRQFAAIKPDGSVLWPELNTRESLEEERQRMGSIIFDREMMSKRGDSAGVIIKSAWLKGWEYDPVTKWARRDPEVRIASVLMGCDPSTGEKETGDPAGFATVVKTLGPGTRVDYWIEALAEGLMTWEERLSQLERMQSFQSGRGPEWRVTRAYIEAIGGFKDFGDQAKKRTSLPIELVTWVKGKRANLAAKSGHFEFGRVHLSVAIPKPLRDKLVDQLTTNDPRHDDLRDSVLLCLEDPTTSMKGWV